MRRNHYILIGILIVAALLRLVNLSAGDTLGDEASYAFRAVGMLDFDEAGDQTTPLEWFSPHIPWWTTLSFHDHPPLVFFVQHIFMKIAGESRFGFRLPSALFGIASVYLLYLIGRRLYSEEIGLAAAGTLAVTVNHVAISRIGIQEAEVIFFMLLAVYFFIRALERDTYLLWAGAAVGFALLTKYTTGILVPIFISYLTLYKREYFFNKKLWMGALLALVIFSPVLIYNSKLYQAVGHFDFQLSYIFGQNPEVWQVAPGKEEFPVFASRLGNFIPNIIHFNSWAMLVLFAASCAGFFIAFFRTPREIARRHALLLISFFWLLALIIVFIGPSFRFLSLLTPWMALSIALIAAARFKKSRPVVLSIFLVFEIFYSVNSQILFYPRGPETGAFSRVRHENYNWGYNELEKFFGEVLEGRMPAFAFEQKYHFIEEVHRTALAKAARDGNEPFPALFVYDRNIQSAAQLWVLDRLQVYHAWPVIPLDTYVQFLREEGNEYFQESGFEETYFITPTKNILWKRELSITSLGAAFEKQLHEQGLAPIRVIKNKRGDDAFRVYKF